LRINDVTERRNLTAFGTECGEYLSIDRNNGSEKNLQFDDVTQLRKFTTNRTEIGENFSSFR